MRSYIVKTSSKIQCVARVVVLSATVAWRVPVPAGAAEDETAGIREQLLRAPQDPALLSSLKATIQKMPPGRDRVRLAVIYTLGSFLVGETEEARTVSAYLKQNDSGNPDLEYLGPAYTHDLCTRCAGDGYVMIPCASCEAGRCAQCAGSGRRIITGFDGKREKCMMCNGTGKCPDCGGVGQKRQRCAACGGSGTVPSREKVRKTYEALLALRDGAVTVAPPVRDVDPREFLSVLNAACRRVLEEASDETREERMLEAQRAAEMFFVNARSSLHSIVREIRYDPQGFAVVKIGAFEELDYETGRRALFFGAKDTFLLKMPPGEAARIRAGASFTISGRVLFNTKPPQAVDPDPAVEPVLTVYLSGTTRRLGVLTLRQCVYSIGQKTYEAGVAKP